MSIGSSVLGNADAELGNFELAALGSSVPDLDQLILQTLSFSQTATYVMVRSKSISQTLTFTETTTGVTESHKITQTLTFTQAATIHSGLKNLSVLQSLGFTQSVSTAGSIHNISITQTLPFQQFANRIVDKQVLDALVFIETTVGQAVKGASQTLAFTETIVANKVYNRAISQTLAFTQHINLGRPLKVNQQFAISQSVKHAYVFVTPCQSGTLGDNSLGDFFVGLDCGADPKAFLTQTLSFDQTVSFAKIHGRHVTQTLDFVQSSQKVFVRNRAISQTLDFYNGYYPKIISLDGTTISWPVASVTKIEKHVIMQSTFGAISLPVPIFNDAALLNNKVSITRVMTRKAFTYVKSSDRVKLTYEYHLGRRKSLELRKFCIDNTDDFVTLINWKGQVYYGKLSGNPITLNTQGRFAKEFESVNVSIEFQGVKISG